MLFKNKWFDFLCSALILFSLSYNAYQNPGTLSGFLLGGIVIAYAFHYQGAYLDRQHRKLREQYPAEPRKQWGCECRAGCDHESYGG